VLSGTHAAPGRQVSTWAHAVKTDESVMLGVSLSFFDPPPELTGLCICPRHNLTHLRNQREGKKPTCVSCEPRFIHTANPSLCLNRLGCCPVYYLSRVAS
jgi:hypothetical protein